MKKDKYFTSHAENESHLFNVNFPGSYDHCLCIPAFNESWQLIENVRSSTINCYERILLILVINQPESITFSKDNIQLFNELITFKIKWQSQNCRLIDLKDFDVLLVDRFSEDKRIPEKLGVGLARKIACDIALKLITLEKIQQEFFFCSDADVIFPDSYFSIFLENKYSAGVLEFSHIGSGNAEIDRATKLYERSLIHYVDGLDYAESTYAYHTIGSCLVINAIAYKNVRGFPKRSAGEDFYLLNKLNKINPIKKIKDHTLQIQSRLSDRVPFGTGPAVIKLLQKNTETAQLFYHPNCFEVLKVWLKFIEKCAIDESRAQNINDDTFPVIQQLSKYFELKTNIDKICKNHSGVDARIRHIHQWFDAFKTLKLIHYLKDNHYPCLSLEELDALCPKSDYK